VLVVGASRGLGRGIAEAFAGAGAAVVAVARDAARLAELAAHRSIQPEVADATDAAAAEVLVSRHRPDVLALVAGATPQLAPLHEQSWEAFSVNWQTDVRIAFTWLGLALRLPLRPGSRVIVQSSGAALGGSPLSGGYAGAKATQRLIARYADDESQRAGLGIRVVAVLPRLTAATELGRPAVAAYAARNGVSEAQFLRQLGTPVTPASAGAAYVDLATRDPAGLAAAYSLSGDGLEPLP
jgi:NAD(P)-dependent dehydrogenase (short-subunit alcohol dehydrogenase family)